MAAEIKRCLTSERGPGCVYFGFDCTGCIDRSKHTPKKLMDVTSIVGESNVRTFMLNNPDYGLAGHKEGMTILKKV